MSSIYLVDTLRSSPPYPHFPSTPDAVGLRTLLTERWRWRHR